MSKSANQAVPYNKRRRSSDNLFLDRSQQLRQRESIDQILLIQAGWVGIALIVVAHIPVWQADSLKRSARESMVNREPAQVESTLQSPPLPATAPSSSSDRQALFVGGSDSLVARAVGHAEGTRTPDGRKTSAYHGHVDPGNGVWNLGSFSFQHCSEARYHCSTPEQADEHQLRRLQGQAAQIQQRMKALGLQMTVEEELNGIDLANQAPLAALSDAGYSDYLLQFKQKGLVGQDAILEARVWSYWNPQTNRWDAAGLGNSEVTIRHDQKRRLLAIARVLSHNQHQTDRSRTAHRSAHLLHLRPETRNPYSLGQERNRYLWWDAGYWDGKTHQRQVPVGYEPAYDAGFNEAVASKQ